MKILVIEPCYVNFGGYFRAYNLSLALSKRGVRVDLLVSSNKNFELKIKKTKINENFRRYELPRVRLTPYLNGRLTRAFIALFFGIFKKYDIIYACVPTQLESNIPAFFLKLIGKSVVIDWDDYWIGSPIFEGHNLVKKYIEFCERRAPAFFENFVVASDFLGDAAKKWGAKRILKIINGVNAEQFAPYAKKEGREKLRLDQNGNYLLAFGNNYANDRGLVLLQIFEKIYALDPEIKLLFNFDSREMVREYRLENKIDQECLKNIINVGQIDQRDLGYYLGACDAAMLPSGDTDDQRAGFPIRVGSYLNGEAVIIMNDIQSEAGNTLQKYSCAIIEKDIADVAKKTVELLRNPALQKELKNKVIEAKKALSWDNLAVGLIEFCRQIIAA